MSNETETTTANADIAAEYARTAGNNHEAPVYDAWLPGEKTQMACTLCIAREDLDTDWEHPAGYEDPRCEICGN